MLQSTVHVNVPSRLMLPNCNSNHRGAQPRRVYLHASKLQEFEFACALSFKSTLIMNKHRYRCARRQLFWNRSWLRSRAHEHVTSAKSLSQGGNCSWLHLHAGRDRHLDLDHADASFSTRIPSSHLSKTTSERVHRPAHDHAPARPALHMHSADKRARAVMNK